MVKKLCIFMILLVAFAVTAGCSNLAGKASEALPKADATATATATSCAATGKFCLWTSMCCPNNKCSGFSCRACYPAGTQNLMYQYCASACCSGKCTCKSTIGDYIRCTCS